MKQLVCEMCGSKDLVKQDGMFVCQTCGTKYSVEEAKKMMIEGTVEVVGTVRIDNSGSYDKFIGLARDAFEDSRYESSYDYSSKALDINTENPEMILLQGLSLFGKEEFGKNIPIGCTNAVEVYLKKATSFESTTETTNELPKAIQYVNSVCNYKIAELDAQIDEIRVDLKPTRGALDVFADLGRPAFVASQNASEDKKIEMHNQQVQTKIYAVQAKINTINSFQDKTVKQMDELSREIAKKRIAEYWNTHADEQTAFENEKENLNEQIHRNDSSLDSQKAAYKKEIEAIPENNSLAKLKEKIEKLAADKHSLGLFKIKEKRAIQSQIDELEVNKAQVQIVVDKKAQEIQCKIFEAQKATFEKNTPLLKRIREIESELIKER